MSLLLSVMQDLPPIPPKETMMEVNDEPVAGSSTMVLYIYVCCVVYSTTVLGTVCMCVV